MSTKFKVDIRRSGGLNDEILKIVSNHNEGLIKASLGTFKGFVEAKQATYPSLYKNTNYEQGNGYLMTVIEDNKPTITIEEIAVFELTELTDEQQLHIYETSQI